MTATMLLLYTLGILVCLNVDAAQIPFHASSKLRAVNYSAIDDQFHSKYHPLFEVESFLFGLADAFPEQVRTVQLGHSAEGREMQGVVISTPGVIAKGKPGNVGQTKDMVILGAQHAREWIAMSTPLYIAHALALSSNASHSSSSYLPELTGWTIHIIPVPNPDGYAFTWETDRFWYKTRQRWGDRKKNSHDEDDECVGVDMNRNYGYKWKAEKKTGKSKPRPGCDHWYPGSRPFEAPETNSIANYVSTLDNPRVFLDVRSYGQMISPPFSFSCKRVPKHAEDQIEAALGAARAIQSVHQTAYTVSPLCESLYSAPGNAVDWMYKRASIPFSYAVHLRDTGTFGYVLPESWIRPVGEETMGMVRYFAGWIK
ncbi:hypothetical protein CPB85DRAFT_1313002 [Mucidula mucida]|nr:hypothetical protein CPB85DRAFT_1313002 [Mucidula mucida]